MPLTRQTPPSPTDPLDHEINAALALLAATEPSPAFQQRLLRSVELLSPATAEKATPFWRLSGLRLATGLGFAVALFLLVRGSFHPSHTPSAPQAMHQAAPSAADQATLDKEATPIAAQPSAEPLPIHLAISNRGASGRQHTPVAPATPSSEDQLAMQALADLHTASHPAPTLELTAQERQIRLMLRRGERRNFAGLDLNQQAPGIDQERAAFSRFFDPPPPPYPLPLLPDPQIPDPQTAGADSATTSAVPPSTPQPAPHP